MASFASLAGGVGSLLDVLREVDVRPIRATAETPFTIVFVSRDEPMAKHLSALMYRGAREHDVPRVRTCIAIPFADRESVFSTASYSASRADLVVIVTDEQSENEAELALVRQLDRAKIPAVVAFLERTDGLQVPLRANWLPAEPITIHLADETLDEADAVRQLVKAIRKLKAIDEIALARHLPAFREAVSRGLIDDVAFANAVYSAGTGVLETNPIATIPLNAADILVLTKNQAIMAYKLALVMGMTAEFRDVMPQLATVVGGGFIFRQVARGLIGLVPGLGIIPKVAVAFAGTYATGEVVYRWCATGDRVTGDTLKVIYDRALDRGKQIAADVTKRVLKPRERRAKITNPRRIDKAERDAKRDASRDASRDAKQQNPEP